MKTKEETAKKAGLALIVSDQIDRIDPFLKNSTLPTNQDMGISYALIGNKDNSYQSIAQNLPDLLAEGKNKSIYVLDDGHWLGLYYNAGEKKLYFIDSFGHDYQDYKKTTAQINASLENHPDITIENLYTNKIQFAEHDLKNCGRFVGMALVLLDSGVKPEEFKRLDSPLVINTPKMTNASLALAQEIDNALFGDQEQKKLSNLRTEITPILLKKALTQYTQIVNDEVKKQGITSAREIIDILENSEPQAPKPEINVHEDLRVGLIETAADSIYTLADSNEKQAQKLIACLQNFIESPNQKNAEQLYDLLSKTLDEATISSRTSNVEKQVIDQDGFSQAEMEQAIKASLQTNPEVKQSSLKEKFITCKECLSLFIRTIGTNIQDKFKSYPEKSLQSNARG